MNNNDKFDDIKELTLKDVSMLLTIKGAEYATDKDRYHNFNIAAYLLEQVSPVTTPAKAAYCFMVKHVVSLIDLLNAEQIANNELIDEKINDIIAYLILIKGMLLEKRTNGDGE